jgi:hypothetical protein
MRKTHFLGLGSLALVGLLAFVGCGGDNNTPVDAGKGGSGGGAGGGAGGTGGKGGSGGAGGAGGVTDAGMDHANGGAGGGTGGQGGGTGGQGGGTGGATDGGTGGGTGGATDGGSGGAGGTGGTTTDGGTGGTGGSSTDASADAGTTPCGGCLAISVDFSASGQNHAIITTFGSSGADLHGATITAHLMVKSAGNGGFLQLYPQDTSFHSDYNSFVSPLPTGWSDVVYHVPAAPLTDPDGGAITYDTTKIRQIIFQVSSAAPPDGGGAATTTIWIDSISITGAPPPVGGGTYTPFDFTSNIAPFSDNGGTGGANASVTWIP